MDTIVLLVMLYTAFGCFVAAAALIHVDPLGDQRFLSYWHSLKFVGTIIVIWPYYLYTWVKRHGA